MSKLSLTTAWPVEQAVRPSRGERGRQLAVLRALIARSLLVTGVLLMAVLVGPSICAGATFTVTNTADSGTGSLRQAIDSANTTANLDANTPDLIDFAISPGSPPFTIQPQSPLPAITDSVKIDGTTQPEFSSIDHKPIIELDGSQNSGLQTTGLTITAGHSTVKGLVINRWAGNGILLSGNEGNVIEGSYIGIDTTGSLARPNAFEAIEVFNSANNRIGGTTPAERNVIWGYRSVELFQGFGAPRETTGNVVEGNYIGTDSTGQAAIAGVPEDDNDFAAVSVRFASGNTIGGSAPGAGNVLAGRNQYGVYIEALPDAGLPASNNAVQGNFIGTDATGTVDLGNSASGVLIFRSSNNTIGGQGAGNKIAFNGPFAGVNLQESQSGESVGNVISSNSIYDNDAGDPFAPNTLGIDLGYDGATSNDPGDLDSGPNKLQNFPELVSVTTTGGTTTIAGTLNSERNKSYRIELFSNGACDPSGFGEGQTFLGSIDVSTDGKGYADFVFSPASAVPAGHLVTATATETPANNTSEFSRCMEVGGHSDSVTQEVGAGGTVRTGTTPTPTDPLVTSVTSPNAGTVSIAEKQTTQGAPPDFLFLGQQVDITAPPATASNPLVVVFKIDSSLLPAGTNETNLKIFKNGHLIGECPGSTVASPDPCVSKREKIDPSCTSSCDIQITVLTSSASAWNFGVPSCNGKRATIIGTNSSETLTGTTGNDVIVGLGGNDTISGRSGNDAICGGLGNDRLDGGPGADFLRGQGGRDTATYATRTSGVTVTLDGVANDGNSTDGPSGARDNVRLDVENLIGGMGGDTLVGSAAANVLTGGLGADSFSALAGNDMIRARNDDLDSSFQCGENAGDTDTVFADAAPDDPVKAKRKNCEVVNKA